ncbi:MAG: binary toxin-like calcium binding domain-containing protein, partial [Terrimicrobiaceae bacterium]
MIPDGPDFQRSRFPASRVFLIPALVAICAWLCAAVSAMASGEVPYFNDFESTVGSEWSSTTTDNSASANFTRFSGNFGGNSTQELSVEGLTVGETYTVAFDLYVLDSWDGNNATAGVGPDYFNVSVNDTQLFHYTFSNVNGTLPNTFQSFPDGPELGLTNLGYWVYPDAVYRNIEVKFTAADTTAVICFQGQNLEPIDNESWGLDNVGVKLTSDLPAAIVATTTLPPEGGEFIGAFHGFSIAASRDLLVSSAAAISNFSLREAGSNGLFGDADDVPVTLLPALNGNRTVAFTFSTSSLPPGKYRFETTSQLVDLDGNAVTVFTREFSVIKDLDGDGMPDSYELANGLNPLLDDSLEDQDGDRVPNIFEYQHGTLANDANSKPEATFVVDPSVPDNSSNGKSCVTIQAAVDKAQEGYDSGQGWVNPKPYAIIEVKAGVYEEEVYIWKVPMLLLGELGSPKGPVEIRPNLRWDDCALYVGSASVVDGFVISHKSGHKGEGVCVGYNANDGTGASKRRFVNCLIHDNHADWEGGGLYNYSADLSLVHCTISGNTSATEGNGIYTNDGRVELINSIVWNPVAVDDPNLADEEIANFGTGFTTSNSIIGGGEQGGINENPQLTASGYLKAGSPAINRPGVTLAKASLVDIHGTRRNINAAPALGVEEWVDTDNDGLPDWWEMKWFSALNAADQPDDNDGLTTAEEFALGADPTKADTDGDGLTDGQEKLLGTNPTNSNTDGDGMPDAYETANGLNLLADDTQLDKDGDGIPNLWEYVNGSLAGDKESMNSDWVVDPAHGGDFPTDNILSTITEAINAVPVDNGNVAASYKSILVKSGTYPESVGILSN